LDTYATPNARGERLQREVSERSDTAIRPKLASDRLAVSVNRGFAFTETPPV
jgi:hypothetical protein